MDGAASPEVPDPPDPPPVEARGVSSVDDLGVQGPVPDDVTFIDDTMEPCRAA